jgi:hypothetical protein
MIRPVESIEQPSKVRVHVPRWVHGTGRSKWMMSSAPEQRGPRLVEVEIFPTPAKSQVH